MEFVHLKTLVLQSQHWPDALLDAVLLPSLTTFDVQIGGFHPEQIPSDSWLQFMALVLRAPDLQSLTLRNINLMVHHIEFMSLLMCVPRLERLVLIDVAADMNAHEMSLEDIHGRLVAGEEIVSSSLPPSCQ